MNITLEHPEVIEEYKKIREGQSSAPLTVSFKLPQNHAWGHGDVIDIEVVGCMPDGGVHDLAFPDRVQVCINLWGVDEQTIGFLQWIIAVWKPTTCFEAGTHKGRSAKAISDIMERNGVGHLTTVDLADHGVEARIPRTTFVQGRLPEVLHEDDRLFLLDDIDFAFLDGPHTAEEAEKEFDYVKARVSKRGCYVVFDDAAHGNWPGVNDFLKSQSGSFILPTPHGLGLIYISPDKRS